MTDAYQEAKRVIIQAFHETPDMTHETTHSIVEYIDTLADAWGRVHALLEGAGVVGDSLATMMNLNRELSGDYTYCVPQRTQVETDYEDSEWLHDCYTMHLNAILQILSVIAP